MKMLLPNDWQLLPLKQVIDKNRPITYGIVQAGPHIEGGIPYIRVSDMTKGRLTLDGMLRTSKEIAHKYKRSTVVTNDIVFALRGAAGAVLKIPDEISGANLTQGTARLAPSDNVTSDYLVQAIRSSLVQKEIEKRLKGSTFKEISLTELEKIKIPIPPLSEQRKIAEILSTWDEAIAKIEQLITALHERKKGLLQRLLTGEIRFSEFKGEWRETELGEFFDFFSKKNAANEDLTILSCSTIHGIVQQSVIFGKRIASEDIRRYKVVQRGDLIFDPMLLWDASIGFLEVVDKGVISPAYSTFKFKKNSGNQLYFKYLLKTHFYRQQYKFISQGTNVRRRKAPVDAFLKLPVRLPSTIEEQNKIVAVLQECDKEIDLYSQKLETLKKQKKGVMQKLLTGQIRVKF